jgi:hypothetical protein
MVNGKFESMVCKSGDSKFLLKEVINFHIVSLQLTCLFNKVPVYDHKISKVSN